MTDNQPYVTVINVKTGDDSGAVTISPAKVYEGETNHNFTITFTPKGPIYDSEMLVTIPAALINDDTDAAGFVQSHTRVEITRDGRTTSHTPSSADVATGIF